MDLCFFTFKSLDQVHYTQINSRTSFNYVNLRYLLMLKYFSNESLLQYTSICTKPKNRTDCIHASLVESWTLVSVQDFTCFPSYRRFLQRKMPSVFRLNSFPSTECVTHTGMNHREREIISSVKGVFRVTEVPVYDSFYHPMIFNESTAICHYRIAPQ